jgi:hypothetical protein
MLNRFELWGGERSASFKNSNDVSIVGAKRKSEMIIRKMSTSLMADYQFPRHQALALAARDDRMNIWVSEMSISLAQSRPAS